MEREPTAFELLEKEIAARFNEKKVNEISQAKLQQLQEAAKQIFGEEAKISDPAQNMFKMVMTPGTLTLYRNPYSVVISYNNHNFEDHFDNTLVIQVQLKKKLKSKTDIYYFKINQSKEDNLLFPVTKEYFIDQFIDFIVTITN